MVENNTQPSLTVYKASAGSGKTFTLATEYIKLLVNNPNDYRHILAVTFTNKATEEMKMRILSQLYGLWRRLPSSRNYSDKIIKDTGLTAEYIASQAGIALTNLLHNYSYFRVETIDSFFQSVLRNLARELDLTANLKIGLNDRQVEEMAVDQLVENLSTTDLMLQWLLSYIMDSISEDRSWNVLEQVKRFGITIFRDYYKESSKELYDAVGQPHFLENYAKTLRQVRKDSKDKMEGYGKRFFEELGRSGFAVGDLASGQKGIASYFNKLSNGTFGKDVRNITVDKSLKSADNWATKTHPRRQEIVALAANTLMPILEEAERERVKQYKLFMSASLTLRHLDQLRLLESIEKKVRELNETSNRFLLSDTQQLLHQLINGSDSPFIFEKIGTQLEHIMIDEFQDTSTVQWQNFKILLQETMSNRHSNLIVGDVKQSIYRWRSGDWRLLQNIKGEFAQGNSGEVKEQPLDINYRSSRRIIDFNNAFFTQAAKTEQVMAYEKDLVQKVKEGRPDVGYVDITLLPSDDYQERVLQLLLQQTLQLISDGAELRDIVILVRNNRFIPLIADYFAANSSAVNIVSDEAFRMDASPAVAVIINAMRYLTHPDDVISKAYLAKTFSGKELHTDSLDNLLPQEFTADANKLMRLPLYELAERLYDIFQLERMTGQSAYLCAFYDMLASFVNEQSADINTFLNEWESSLSSQTIQSPDVNGIRLISIHKSKGLEFPHVLIPFCDWQLEMSDVLWCHPSESPFDALPIVPIDFSAKNMKGTIYERDYDEEHSQNTIDNLNLLYVAFTRASENLYVIGKRGAKGRRSDLLETALPDVAKVLEGSIISMPADKKSALTFTYGTPLTAAVKASLPKEEKEQDPEPNVFTLESTPVDVNIGVYKQKVTFRQSNNSRMFAVDPNDAANDETIDRNRYIQTGTVLHQLFSTIRTADDIPEALQRMEFDGVLYDSQLTPDNLERMIRKRLAVPQVARWFSPEWTLFNECTILSIDPQTGKPTERRPDRVMTNGEETIVVDFKFGSPHEGYEEQVQKYMDLLQEMGHTNVSGYLWYVYSNKITEVKSK